MVKNTPFNDPSQNTNLVVHAVDIFLFCGAMIVATIEAALDILSGRGKISASRGQKKVRQVRIGRNLPLFIGCLLFCIPFTIIGASAATGASDLAVWQTLWDSWNMGSATCEYGNLDGCTRGDPCGTCTDYYAGDVKNIQCTSTADGNAITVLRIYSCGLSGTLFA